MKSMLGDKLEEVCKKLEPFFAASFGVELGCVDVVLAYDGWKRYVPVVCFACDDFSVGGDRVVAVNEVVE